MVSPSELKELIPNQASCFGSGKKRERKKRTCLVQFFVENSIKWNNSEKSAQVQ
jgi:hypothetical protein